MADSQDTTRPKASGNQADNPTTGSVPSQLHKTPYVAFPTVEDLPKAYKASKVKKSGRGRRFNGKHND